MSPVTGTVSTVTAAEITRSGAATIQDALQTSPLGAECCAPGAVPANAMAPGLTRRREVSTMDTLAARWAALDRDARYSEHRVCAEPGAPSTSGRFALE